MEIIKCTSKNIKEIVSFNNQLYIDIPNFIWNNPKWILKQIKRGNFYCLMNKGSVCGALCLIISEKKGKIETLAVRKDSHKNSYGKELINFAKIKLKKLKIKILYVNSFYSYNLKNFYKKQGFNIMDKPGIYEGINYYKFFMKL